jgi:hypothetical protein
VLPQSRRPGGSADGFIPRNEKFCRLHVSTTATYRGLETPIARYDKPKLSTKILSTRDMTIHAFRIDRACGTLLPGHFLHNFWLRLNSARIYSFLGNGVCLLLRREINTLTIEVDDSYLTLKHVEVESDVSTVRFLCLGNLRKSQAVALPFSPNLTDGFFANCICLFASGVRDPRELEFRRDRPLPFPDPELFAISINSILLSQ